MTDPAAIDPEARSRAIAAIKAQREATNRLIAEHDARGLRIHLTDDMLLVVGDGGLIDGAAPVVEAWVEQFKDPDLITYVRTPETIEIADHGLVASEQGRWVGTWKNGLTLTGVYLAGWRWHDNWWLIEREMFVTLTREGPKA